MAISCGDGSIATAPTSAQRTPEGDGCKGKDNVGTCGCRNSGATYVGAGAGGCNGEAPPARSVGCCCGCGGMGGGRNAVVAGAPTSPSLPASRATLVITGRPRNGRRGAAAPMAEDGLEPKDGVHRPCVGVPRPGVGVPRTCVGVLRPGVGVDRAEAIDREVTPPPVAVDGVYDLSLGSGDAQQESTMPARHAVPKPRKSRSLRAVRGPTSECFWKALMRSEALANCTCGTFDRGAEAPPSKFEDGFNSGLNSP
mmetsp:Transcript_23488/g.65313  ORF Transcript_23488/g.65313 Transcript_23488/m.65313 type:complete len:254 (-) Transcript_23488:587-1348(-)